MVKIMDIIDKDIGNHVLLITYDDVEFINQNLYIWNNQIYLIIDSYIPIQV